MDRIVLGRRIDASYLAFLPDKARRICDHLSVYALRPAADGVVKGAPGVKEILFGFFPASNVFVVHAFTPSPRTVARQAPVNHAARNGPRARGPAASRPRRLISARSGKSLEAIAEFPLRRVRPKRG